MARDTLATAVSTQELLDAYSVAAALGSPMDAPCGAAVYVATVVSSTTSFTANTRRTFVCSTPSHIPAALLRLFITPGWYRLFEKWTPPCPICGSDDTLIRDSFLYTKTVRLLLANVSEHLRLHGVDPDPSELPPLDADLLPVRCSNHHISEGPVLFDYNMNEAAEYFCHDNILAIMAEHKLSLEVEQVVLQ